MQLRRLSEFNDKIHETMR